VLSVDWRDDVLVSGGADSTIIVWNPKEGTQRSVISVDTSKKEKTLVWQVKYCHFLDEYLSYPASFLPDAGVADHILPLS
jgi:WD40 repeat protein